MLRTRAGLAVFLALSVAVGSSVGGQTRATDRPTHPAFEQAVKAAAELPRLHSLLVSWRGELVLERYFNGRRAASLANIKSASKTILSALVGMGR